MQAQLTEKLRGFVTDNFLFGDADRLPADDASLLGNGILDSTGVLELIEYLESEFGIRVADTETVPQNLDSIAGLAQYVTRKQAGDET